MAKGSIEQTTYILEAEKTNLSPEQREQLDELEVGVDVREGVANAIEAKEKRELTPEQAGSLISTLRSRFELPENKELREEVGDFADVEKSLRAAPEKLYALYRLEETGGEPQVIRRDIGNDRCHFYFEDCSIESPSGRRSLDFDQSLAQSEEFGVDMQSADAYETKQTTGEFDCNSFSWLLTNHGYRQKKGRALRGRRGLNSRSMPGGEIHEISAKVRSPNAGWRASLMVELVK